MNPRDRLLIHNIQADVPPENILAMWEALQEYGR
jgi:uroporphyrinogen decarboxylase